jgi:serine protease Do
MPSTSSPLSRSTAQRLAQAALALAFCMCASAAPAATNAFGLPDFTELVEKVGPAVVNIRTIERGRQARGGSGDPDDDMAELLRRFFGQPPPGQQPRPTPRQLPDEQQQRGFASGFILTNDGYVLTNAHVIDGADEVTVTLVDKREFKARTIGIDKRSDVALVKIEGTGLPTVRIGDVSKLKTGEWVIAIGSPFGLESTVTAGIVSAKSRDTGDLLPLIQTDVAINPGNSGGPLINMRGEVVGINSQIYSRSGGYMGISFAIPIDEATRVYDQLRASGRVIRGRIGVVIDPVTREVAESIGLGKPVGALVRSVEAGGPADKAGVEPGDIITRVDARPVDSSVELPRIVGNIKPGTKATLQVFRRGSTRDIPVTVVEFDTDRVVARAAPESTAKPSPVTTSIGLAVSDLTEAQKRDGKTKSGVRVDSVDGPAARAGIRENDVILSLDNVEVTGAKQFEGLLAKLDKSKSVTLLVRQGDVARFVIVRPNR